MHKIERQKILKEHSQLLFEITDNAMTSRKKTKGQKKKKTVNKT